MLKGKEKTTSGDEGLAEVRVIETVGITDRTIIGQGGHFRRYRSYLY